MLLRKHVYVVLGAEPMRGRSLAHLGLISCSVLLTLSLPAWGQSSGLTLDQILTRMQQAERDSRAQSVAYTVTREYQLSAQGAQRPSSQVVAQVNVIPPASKDYSIVKTEGSDRGASIVRKVLDHEAEMAGHSEQHEISRRNYEFALLGREAVDGHECYVLQLKPKRQEAELINGKAWVDAQSFELRQIKGATAKNPSMWIRGLTLTINYGQVNGVWVQTATQAVADVRFAGPHVLTSRELEVRPALLNAQAKSYWQARQRRNNQHVEADTAAWMAR
jgi:outer membrane lipoprotein-sorting protein